jgi:hypothetical protein
MNWQHSTTKCGSSIWRTPKLLGTESNSSTRQQSQESKKPEARQEAL